MRRKTTNHKLWPNQSKLYLCTAERYLRWHFRDQLRASFSVFFYRAFLQDGFVSKQAWLQKQACKQAWLQKQDQQLRKLSFCFAFFFFFFFKIYLCMWVHSLSLSSNTAEESIGDSITDGCELPFGCWELNSGPLKEQPVLLTTESSLQPPPLQHF
jgi:hypothetical protein